MISLEKLGLLLDQLWGCYSTARPLTDESIQMWQRLLGDCTEDEFIYGAECYENLNETGFPPAPGQILAHIKERRRVAWEEKRRLERDEEVRQKANQEARRSGRTLSKDEREEQVAVLCAKYPDLLNGAWSKPEELEE